MEPLNPTLIQWRKSSYSNGSGDCVEVAMVSDQLAVRDSKNPEGPVLVVASEVWGTFVQGVAGAESSQS